MVQFYNQLTAKKEVFKPLDKDHVRLYVCGPTVYDEAHIGNARPVVVFDLLVRLLRHLYEKVTYVRNITDVDDKIILSAKNKGEDVPALTKRMTLLFHEDMEYLGTLPPDVEPRATDHIDAMIAMIKVLLAKNHAYLSGSHILFSVPSWQDYGILSKREETAMMAGARVAVEDYKKDPRDFVLWKPAKEDEISWESPWGRGRPGWHIECSAMSHHYLGTPFDIHGGGLDLIFPHHENEIAQSCACYGTPSMARVWMHNGYVTCDGEKMSKSLGNVHTIRSLRETWRGEVLRYFLLMTHYRKPLDCSPRQLQQAERSLDNLYRMKEDVVYDEKTPPCAAVMEALCNDMNVPFALTHLHDALSKGGDESREALVAAHWLGFLREETKTWFQDNSNGNGTSDIASLIKERALARGRRDFQAADEIRKSLKERGIILEDKGKETTWRQRRRYE